MRRGSGCGVGSEGQHCLQSTSKRFFFTGDSNGHSVLQFSNIATAIDGVELSYIISYRCAAPLHQIVEIAWVGSWSEFVTMPVGHSLNFGVSAGILGYWILLSYCSGFVLSGVVTLDSIKIYNTHELFKIKPTVYFRCKGEDRVELPDVKEVNVSYSFNGEESWQPLTQITDKKCKRCGFYEKDIFKPDDVFDEWELCPSDFKDSDGKYRRITDNEFNATFLCLQCASLGADDNTSSHKHDRGNGMHLAVIIVTCVLVSTVLILALFTAFKYWQKRKRKQEQARFLKVV